MSYCERCERYFSSQNALANHERDSNMHWICYDCDKDFTSWNGLQQHYIQARRHHYCQRCNEHFGAKWLWTEHMDERHYYCEEHNKIFDTLLGLKEHYVQSNDHYYCQKCGIHFDTRSDQYGHYYSDHHFCRSCETFFASEQRLKIHYSEEHYYCDPCDRFFMNQNNLNQHLRSATHQPANVRCPGRNCGRAFVSMSALALHFEAGTCPSGMTRDQLNRIVVSGDRNNVITNPARLLTGPDGPSPPHTTTTYATARAWNGHAFECFLCHRDFGTLHSLNAHLQSPKHQERIYRCPLSTCRIEFSAMSSLCQHVENGSCGVRMFKQVQNTIDGLVRGMRSIAF